MPNWITIRHSVTDALSVVPESALPGYELRGWVKDEPGKSPEVVRKPTTKKIAPEETDSPEVKENS